MTSKAFYSVYFYLNTRAWYLKAHTHTNSCISRSIVDNMCLRLPSCLMLIEVVELRLFFVGGSDFRGAQQTQGFKTSPLSLSPLCQPVSLVTPPCLPVL